MPAGAVIGLINGLIIAYLNVTPFITTLGTMIIVYGINSLYYDFVGASPISGFDSGFYLAQGFVALGSFVSLTSPLRADCGGVLSALCGIKPASWQEHLSIA